MKLSIVTINLNNRQGLEKTIASVINQKKIDFEYIIIDGGSKDGSIHVIEQFKNNISKWISENDSGIFKALNKGIKLAIGEYILFLHSGDVLLNNNILFEIFNEKHTEDILYGDIKYYNPKTERYMVTSLPETLDLYFFYKQNLWHQASFIKKELFEKIGLYNEENKYVSDWQFFFEAIIDYQVIYKNLQKCITNYDMYNGISIHHRSESDNEKQKILKLKLAEPILNLLEKTDGLNNALDKIYRSEGFRIYNFLLKHNWLLILNTGVMRIASSITRLIK